MTTSSKARLMADLKNADQSFSEYREKFAQMDDENKQLQRQLDDATLKRESAHDRLRAFEVGYRLSRKIIDGHCTYMYSLCALRSIGPM